MCSEMPLLWLRGGQGYWLPPDRRRRKIVIKKDRSREVFNREKLLNGLLRACEKRAVSLDKLEAVVDEIEGVIQNSLDREVTSDKIGELVMEKLKEIDEVAYVRFASVYRQFKDVGTFMKELQTLLDK